MLPAASIDASLREIRRRYGDDDEYHAELARVGLDVPSLRQAVARDLVVEAVLEKVAARLAAVSDTDVEIFWYMNQQRFRHGDQGTAPGWRPPLTRLLAGNLRARFTGGANSTLSDCLSI
jgi:peptidyl-prolyl cis-trans isomerase C